MNRPNILLIHTDQQRYDCLGATGNADLKTPHIDRLAEDSTLYCNSFCPYPVCTPSRYSLLTGLYVHQHMGMSNDSTLPSGIPTLPSMLKNNGYRTSAVGKMHFAPTYLDVGFDDMCLAEQFGPGRFEDDYHRWLKDEGLCDRHDMIDEVWEFRKQAPAAYWDTFGVQRSDLDEQHHSTTWIGDRAVERLENWDDQGQFMMVGFIKPHHPFDPPAPWDTMYDPRALSLLPGWTDDLILGDDGKLDYVYFDYANLTEARLRRVMALYYATISQIDHHVGRMIDILKQRGLYDNTVIVYTSDHGDYMGYHHRILKGYRMFEPLVRVPLIIKYPTVQPHRATDDRLVNNIDLAPTLLALAGLKPSRHMKGINLAQDDARPDYVFAESDNEYMIRSRTHKLLIRPQTDETLFFDLEEDPLEMTNLAHNPGSQSAMALLRERLFHWICFGSRPPKHLDRHAPKCPAEHVPTVEEPLYPYFRQAFHKR